MASARILLVEDLTDTGRRGEPVGGDPALRRLSPAQTPGPGAARPDLIQLDLRLPDMPGEEVLRRLRADARTLDIPVIILSADATRERIAQLRAEGVMDYLTKPIDVRGLLRAVDAALGEERPGTGAPARETRPAATRRAFSSDYY